MTRGSPLTLPLTLLLTAVLGAACGSSHPATDAGGEAGLGDAGRHDWLGGPCPCPATMVCTLSACRARCSELACNGAAAGCQSGESCVTTTAGTSVCLPAKAVGETCTAVEYCQGGSVCISEQAGASGKCYATCPTAGAACASGTCAKMGSTGCNFCP